MRRWLSYLLGCVIPLALFATLPSSGPIDVAAINVELGFAANTGSSLNDPALRSLAGIPAGQISLSDFYGKTKPSSNTSATGGTITTQGPYTIHTFTGSGTFQIISIKPGATFDIEVVGGGGGGGHAQGGVNGAGGGGGQFIAYNGVTLSVTSYAVTVGAGAAAGLGTSGTNGPTGGASSFQGQTAANGGQGGQIGGYFGGTSGGGQVGGGGGSGIAGGGGGQTGPGLSANGSAGSAGGLGGLGATSAWDSTKYSGGGGGGSNSSGGYSPDSSGGGSGGINVGTAGQNGVPNTGGGGGGGGAANGVPAAGGAGGAGVVRIRYLT